MPQSSFDTLRALAIGTQALGLALIITLETVLGDAARPWQGGVLAAMVACALVIALVRVRNRCLCFWRDGSRLSPAYS